MAWFNTAWGYRKKVTLSAGVVAATLTNVPLLCIVPSDGSFATNAQTSGNDFVVTSDDETTQVAHEIEKYDSATGELIIWIYAPSLTVATEQDFYIYYGNPSSGNQQNAAGVWGAKYGNVLHLKESISTAAEHFRDSSGNARHYTLTPDTTGYTSVAALWGNGVQNLSLDANKAIARSDYTLTTEDCTLFCWAKFDNTLINKENRIQTKQNNTAESGHDYLVGVGTTARSRGRLKTGGTTTTLVTATVDFNLTDWFLVGLRYNLNAKSGVPANTFGIFRGTCVGGLGVWAGIVASRINAGAPTYTAGVDHSLFNYFGVGSGGIRAHEGIIKCARQASVFLSDGELETTFNVECDATTSTGAWALGSVEQAPVPIVTTPRRRSPSGDVSRLLLTLTYPGAVVPALSSVDVTIADARIRAGKVVRTDLNKILAADVIEGPHRTADGSITIRLGNPTAIDINQGDGAFDVVLKDSL